MGLWKWMQEHGDEPGLVFSVNDDGRGSSEGFVWFFGSWVKWRNENDRLHKDKVQVCERQAKRIEVFEEE